MRIPTENEITQEASRDNDFFNAKARLEQQFRAAESAVEKLKPVANETDAAPWNLEPSTAEVLTEAKNFSLTVEDARESLKRKLAADARRLAAFAPAASAEISEALGQAEAARARAENLLAEHEAKLAAVTNGIHTLGKIRQKIFVAKTLLLSEDNKRELASAALDYFVSMKTGFQSPQVNSGFRAMSEDLAFRTVLNDHISDFCKPLEKQAATIIASVRAQADDAKMDLKKVFALLANERGQRGESLLHDSIFYAGLI